MSLKLRVEKLEAPGLQGSCLPKIIGFASVRVGETHLERELLGYEVKGIKYLREPGELENDFVDRVICESGHDGFLSLGVKCIFQSGEELCQG